jgi:hypothetical protein
MYQMFIFVATELFIYRMLSYRNKCPCKKFSLNAVVLTANVDSRDESQPSHGFYPVARVRLFVSKI